jgi:large subunit ribosomal protein L24
MKIKKGDNIIVIAGKDKGKTGKVLKSFPSLNKVLVEGINVVKKNSKNKFSSDKKGEIIDKTMPINVSNVSLIDPKTKKPTRVFYKEVDGKKIRISKKTKEEIK